MTANSLAFYFASYHTFYVWMMENQLPLLGPKSLEVIYGCPHDYGLVNIEAHQLKTQILFVPILIKRRKMKLIAVI